MHRRRAVDRRAGRQRRVNRRHPQRPNGGSPAAGRHVWARSAFSTRPSDGTHFFARHSRSSSWPYSIDCHSQRRSFARRDAVKSRKTAGLTATRAQGLRCRRGLLRPEHSQNPTAAAEEGTRSSLFKQRATRNRTSYGCLSFPSCAAEQVGCEQSTSTAKSNLRHVGRTKNSINVNDAKGHRPFMTMWLAYEGSVRGSRIAFARFDLPGHDTDRLSATCTFRTPASVSCNQQITCLSFRSRQPRFLWRQDWSGTPRNERSSQWKGTARLTRL